MSRPAVPQLLESDNLSLAWGGVLSRILGPGGTDVSPLVLSITGFDDDGDPSENAAVRAALEELLASEGKRDIENVAFTIFPKRYYKMVSGDRAELYSLYRESFSRIQDYNPRNNKRGSYFQRLIDLAGDGSGPNQLEWILSEYEARPQSRRSKWQATTFDPKRDHTTSAQLEFPCLQQVSFTFDCDEGLILNAFYATQQIVRKGYGNYLGLSHLGGFMAKEMGLKFVRLNVFVGIAKADEIRKSDPGVQNLLSVIEQELGRSKSHQAAA